MSSDNEERIVVGTYWTRAGKPVRVLAVDLQHPVYPILGTIFENNEEVAITWTIEGEFLKGTVSRLDLLWRSKDYA